MQIRKLLKLQEVIDEKNYHLILTHMKSQILHLIIYFIGQGLKDNGLIY